MVDVKMCVWLKTALLVLVAISGTTGLCTSGLEGIGKFTVHVESQLDNVLKAASRNCRRCKDCPGCVHDVIDALKSDIQDFRQEWYNIVDVSRNSGCVFPAPTILLGGETTGVVLIDPSGATTNPGSIMNINGLDFNVNTGELFYNTVTKLFKTDQDGNSPELIKDFDPQRIMSPEMVGGELFFGLLTGGVYKYADNKVEEFITSAQNENRGVHGIAIDSTEGHIYWSTATPMTSIYQATLTTGEDVRPFITDTREIMTVVLDEFSRTLYYTTVTPPMLVRYNLITGETQDLTDLPRSNSDMSVCLNSVYVSYNGDWFYEQYDSDGTMVHATDPVTSPPKNDFYGIATSNIPNQGGSPLTTIK